MIPVFLDNPVVGFATPEGRALKGLESHCLNVYKNKFYRLDADDVHSLKTAILILTTKPLAKKAISHTISLFREANHQGPILVVYRAETIIDIPQEFVDELGLHSVIRCGSDFEGTFDFLLDFFNSPDAQVEEKKEGEVKEEGTWLKI